MYPMDMGFDTTIVSKMILHFGTEGVHLMGRGQQDASCLWDKILRKRSGGFGTM